MGATHVILVTHTPERLRLAILGVAWSSARGDTLTLSCDADDPAIEAAARGACAEGGVGMTLLLRAGAGAARPAQVRNNAVRDLLGRGAGPSDALVFFDGDCVPEHRAIERHAALLGRGALVIGWRYDLTEAQTAALDESALRAGRMPFAPEPEQERALARRHARLRRQGLWRRVGLGKAHKPKVLGANFSCSVRTYAGVNGFDETYDRWGQEDDDLGRRIYAQGGRAVVAVREVLAFHQHHVTRAPGAWDESANAARLSAPCVAVCERGLEGGVEQAAIRRMEIGPDGR